MRPEYDLAALGSGVRGKYAKQLQGTTLVALQSEVAKAFHTSQAVNEALRIVLKATASVRRAAPVAKRSSRRPAGSRDRRSGIRAGLPVSGLVQHPQRLAVAWGLLVPLWFLTLAALVWGRTALAKDEVLKGLVWTLGASVVAFPFMWAMLSYCAGFNPRPKASAIRAARRREAPARTLVVRVIAGVVLTAIVVLALVGLGVAPFFAAGPNAFG